MPRSEAERTTLSATGAINSSRGSASTNPPRYVACRTFCATRRPNFSKPCSFNVIQTLRALNPLKSCGLLWFKEEGTLRNHMVRPDGSLRHSTYFSVTVEEWPLVEKHLVGLKDAYV